MKLTEKRKRRIKYIIFSFMVICITPLCEKGRILNGAALENNFAGEEIICAIDLGDDMYGKQGLKNGLSYELLNKFAKDNRCNVKIVTAFTGEDYVDSLKTGAVDILITPYSDSIMNQANARQIDQNTVWSVNSDNVSKVRTLDIWLTHIKGSHEYEQLQRKYYRSYNPHKKAEKGIKVSHVSPYDSIIKKYAKELGWDWRMLAAVVYQESKFSINSVSHRGARGLMQVMPKTAQYYGIEDLNDPDQNLKAGTSHLLRLQNMYAKSGMDKTEMIKFTLAAYNAGEGRIADCRNFAASKGIDKNSWDEIVSLIPLMREDSILEEKSVKLGKFKGHETIAYVNNVMSLYESFCTIHPSI
jgi:membrane-bound lytic murein transglycosylase F